MKNIFFYANVCTFDYTLGITRKVFSQINAFSELGYNVTYSGYKKNGVAIFKTNGEVLCEKHYPTSNEKICHVIRRNMLMNLCLEYLKGSKERIDIFYARYHFFDRHYIKLLKSAKEKNAKVIVEAHSSPKFEKSLSIMTPVYINDSIWNRYGKRYIDVVAAMCNDEYLWGIKTIQFANAIDINTVKLHQPNIIRHHQKEIHLIAVAFEGRVHGFDRLINGLYQYKKNDGEWDFIINLVGTQLNSTVKLIHQLKLEDSCLCHAPMMGEELDTMFDGSEIGIGCLANHRIGSYFGSAIKTKEYLAKGIPFIYGWREEILDDGYPYAKRVELNEEPINMQVIIDLYESTRNIPDLQNQIRKRLRPEDSWVGQMKKVIN